MTASTNPTPGGSPPGAEPTLDVTIPDRAHDAYRMHLAGADGPAIATALGYASGKSASMAVTAFLQKAGLEHGVEQRRIALQLELDRLDALQAGLWDQAVDGDLKAAVFVLGLLERRVKLLGLDRPSAQRKQRSPYSLVIDDD